jgi:hypothetical protein
MTGNAINAKSGALELHELSSEDLDAVSGGDLNIGVGVCTRGDMENKKQADAVKAFQQMLQELP